MAKRFVKVYRALLLLGTAVSLLVFFNEIFQIHERSYFGGLPNLIPVTMCVLMGVVAWPPIRPLSILLTVGCGALLMDRPEFYGLASLWLKGLSAYIVILSLVGAVVAVQVKLD